MRKTGCAGRYAHAEQIRLLQEEGHVGVLTVLREAHFVVGVGDAALTRPGRTISLGEGNMHTRVDLCDPRLPRLVLSKVSSRLPLRVRWGWQFAAA